jgi:hypothetical protein
MLPLRYSFARRLADELAAHGCPSVQHPSVAMGFGLASGGAHDPLDGPDLRDQSFRQLDDLLHAYQMLRNGGGTHSPVWPAAAAAAAAVVAPEPAAASNAHGPDPPHEMRGMTLLYALLHVVDPSIGLLSVEAALECVRVFRDRLVASFCQHTAGRGRGGRAVLSAEGSLVDDADGARDVMLLHVSGVLDVALVVEARRGGEFRVSPPDAAPDSPAVLVRRMSSPRESCYTLHVFDGDRLRVPLAEVRRALASRAAPSTVDADTLSRMTLAELRVAAGELALLPLPLLQAQKRVTKTALRAAVESVLQDTVV